LVTKLFKVFGDSNEKQIKKLRPIVQRVNALEQDMQRQTDDQLKAKTGEFKERLDQGKDELDDLLPEAFAAVREASRRAIGLHHFDVQIIGGTVLHQGKVAEMKTGEGKTLVATLPSYLNALTGGGVHVVTVNDYLARRDAAWMGPIYHALGLTVACLQHESAFMFDPAAEEADGTPRHMRRVNRRDAYAADILYGTNNEFGFDYLRDNMAASKAQQVQRALNYAIVDEVDNILIDEARTPLIISGPSQESTGLYKTMAQLALRLNRDEDFTAEEKEKQVLLTEAGISNVERILNVKNLYAPENYHLTHFVENALRAQHIYLRDKDYVVRDGEVVIVDEFTGRLMPGRRYSDGMHQALEAKEGVNVQRETITYATITLQNYFRMYPKLAGMTGTAMTEAEEFYKVYKLEVVAIPTNEPMARHDEPDLVYKTEDAKFKAVADYIEELHRARRPVLVGTVSIERSEVLSATLKRRGVPHEVLNAKNHEREAKIVANAGRPGAVTVSTNMAGRGTDIILGGSPDLAASADEWRQAHDEVVQTGGLYVLGTERHESRRIDNQLRGRAGRQGDPGVTRFYGSLQDDIIKRFGSGMVGRMVSGALADDQPLESGLLTRTLEMVQGKVEAYYFDIRKHLVDYDDVVNKHREVIYAERAKVLEGADLRDNIERLLEREVDGLIATHLRGPVETWDIDGFLTQLGTVLALPAEVDADFVATNTTDDIRDAVLAAIGDAYDQGEEQFTPDVMRALERSVMLQTIDRWWVQHLTAMSNLRQGIGLQAVGQRDPLVAYKTEGHEQFQALLDRIQHDIVHTIFHVAPMSQAQVAQQQQRAQQAAMPKGATPKRGDAPAARVSGVETDRIQTMMSKANASAGGDATSAEPRWMRRRNARAKSKGR